MLKIPPTHMKLSMYVGMHSSAWSMVFRPSSRIVMGGGGMGVAYHMHFAYIVVHNNIMYRYTAIDVFNTKG